MSDDPAMPPIVDARKALEAAREYRGWSISHDYPPVPCRDFDWSATHPNYDPTPYYSDDGPSDHHHVHAATLEGVRAEIDAWIMENDE